MDKKEVTTVTQEEINEFYAYYVDDDGELDLTTLNDDRWMCFHGFTESWLCHGYSRDEQGLIEYFKKEEGLYIYLYRCWPGSTQTAIVNSEDFLNSLHSFFVDNIESYLPFTELDEARREELYEQLENPNFDNMPIDYASRTYDLDAIINKMIDRVSINIGNWDFQCPEAYNPFAKGDSEERVFMWEFFEEVLPKYLEEWIDDAEYEFTQRINSYLD